MINLTEDEKVKITLEMMREQPMETIGQLALLKLGKLAITTNAETAKLTTEATIEGKRYEMTMLITYRELHGWELHG